MAKVAKVIKALRDERGWTQAELAERAGISLDYTKKIECGAVGVPSLRVLRRIGDALRVSVETLLAPLAGVR